MNPCSFVFVLLQQVQEYLPGPDLGTSYQADVGELGELSFSAVDDLRVELDQSELRKQQLQEQVHLLSDEAAELKQEVADLQGKLFAAENANHKPCKEVPGKVTKFSCKEDAEARALENGHNTVDWVKQAERLSQELKAQGEKLKESEEVLAKLRTSSEKERAVSLQQVNELQVTVSRLNEALSMKGLEVKNLHTQLQDIESSLQERIQQLEEVKKKAKREHEELQQKSTSIKEALEGQIVSLQEQLKEKEINLSVSTQKIQQLENQRLESQSKKLEEYKTQCVSLMEINAKLVSTVKRSEESNKELAETKAVLERELTSLKASEKQKKTKDRHGELDNGPSCMENMKVSDQELKDVQKEELPKQNDHRKDLHLSQHPETEEAACRLALAEAQLALNMKEVSRLQEEVVDLQARLQMTSEERMKVQALHEVTEASKADLCAQTEQLKSQVEDLNRRHVEELLHCREKEEALEKKLNAEAQVRANLQTKLESIRHELDVMKKQNNALALEYEEAREALHRANTETAELGIQVCSLTGKNEELSTKLQELLVAQNDSQNLNDFVETLKRDNSHLKEELKEADGLMKAKKELQQRLEGAKEEARSLRKNNQKELHALQLQLTETTSNHQNQLKVILNFLSSSECSSLEIALRYFPCLQVLNEELLGTRSQMETEQEKVSALETRLAELEVRCGRARGKISPGIVTRSNHMCLTHAFDMDKQRQYIHTTGKLTEM